MDWYHVALAALLAANAIGWAYSRERTRDLLAEMQRAVTRIEGLAARPNQGRDTSSQS